MVHYAQFAIKQSSDLFTFSTMTALDLDSVVLYQRERNLFPALTQQIVIHAIFVTISFSIFLCRCLQFIKEI